MFDGDGALTVRTATNADREEIQRLVFGVLREYDLAPDVDGTDRDLTDIEENYLNRGGTFEVLENASGEIVGTVGLFPLDDETIELRKMYFSTEIRGRGLGKEFLARTLKKARNLGYLRVYLETAFVLKQAVHIYEKAGFKPVDVKHTPRCDQGYVLELDEE
jgi:N-acetylglutamate synthase-like GNAT family acetyltransferase